jgi:hypothetical protein
VTATPPPKKPALDVDRIVMPGTRLPLLLLATRRLGELLADDTRMGQVDPLTVRAAADALSGVSRGVYEALSTATEHGPEHAQNRLAEAAVAAGEHSVRLAQLVPDLDAMCTVHLDAALLGAIAADGTTCDQANQLAGRLCHLVRAAAATPRTALQAAPQLVGYPEAASVATRTLAGAAAAIAAPGEIVEQLHAAARVLDAAPPPGFLGLNRSHAARATDLNEHVRRRGPRLDTRPHSAGVSR